MERIAIGTIPPNIEERFMQPDGWRWHSFERNNKTIRFGTVSPKDSIPDATLICLQGVREFSEKYFEIAHWCIDNNLAFWTLDWAGQGQSTRYLTNPQKRHSDSFQHDIDDLHYLIMEYIKHSSVHPDKGRIPMAMLAHSTGSNIGLHYLQQYPETFECAAFSAPLIGIKKFSKSPQILAQLATALCHVLIGKSYIPGGNDWDKRTENARLTHDPIRKLIHNQWCAADSALQCGDVTFTWLHEAQKSCMKLQSPSLQTKIITPCLFGIAAHEDLVDNKMAEKVISGIKNAKIIDYPEAFHEILMENNDIRDNFLDHIYTLIKESIIERPETLKPF